MLEQNKGRVTVNVTEETWQRLQKIATPFAPSERGTPEKVIQHLLASFEDEQVSTTLGIGTPKEWTLARKAEFAKAIGLLVDVEGWGATPGGGVSMDVSGPNAAVVAVIGTLHAIGWEVEDAV